MAEIVYRFDNTPWGGNHNVTLKLAEMPDFHSEAQQESETLDRANRGKIWQYIWYRKEARVLPFRAVGSAVTATMGSLALEAVNIRWYKDLNNSGGTGTMVYIGGPFDFTPLTPSINDFDFPMEELE